MILWEIDDDHIMKIVKRLNYHFQKVFNLNNKINSIFISSRLRCFGSAGDDGIINIFNFNGKIIKSYNHP